MNCLRKIILATLLISSSGHAQNLQDQYYTARPKGMGGAFTSIANDKNAIWYNPGGITRLRKARSRGRVHLVSIPNLQATANKNGYEYVSSLLTSNSDSLADIITDNSDEFTDENIFANLGLSPYIAFELAKKSNTVVALGGYTQGRLTSIVDTTDYSTVQTSNLFDVGGLASIAWSTRTNLFSVGLQVRPAKRYNYEDVLSDSVITDVDALTSRMKEYANSTFGVGLDFGMIYTFADLWFPTLAVSVYNLPISCKTDYLNPFSATRQSVCGTVYRGDVKNDDATGLVDPMNMMAGLSMTPRITRKVALRIAAEYHHINFQVGDNNWGLSDISWQKKIHGELSFLLVTHCFHQGFL